MLNWLFKRRMKCGSERWYYMDRDVAAVMLACAAIGFSSGIAKRKRG